MDDASINIPRLVCFTNCRINLGTNAKVTGTLGEGPKRHGGGRGDRIEERVVSGPILGCIGSNEGGGGKVGERHPGPRVQRRDSQAK